ncbi:MAG: hypothetical protein KAT17_05020 [Candidatus Aminicenantes bacterium]|nr:hypothetical protein [Candidatus Aminicenantes bacterium]
MTAEKMKFKKEVNPIVLQNGIFVAGHPRSGTSLACQLLESAGVHFLSDLAADEYNKEGYFELSTAKELEKKLIEKAMTEENVAELNKIIRELNQPKGLTGLKIVHIPSIFFYRHIAKKIRAVFIFRNPSDTKSSILRRGISEFKLSWFDNNNALVAAHENIPKSIVISYDSLIEGKQSVAKAFKKLGFNLKMDTIKKGYQTQKNSQLILTADEEKLYHLLKKLEKKSLK